MYIKYNPNYKGQSVGDCSVRALTKAIDKGWVETFLELAVYGLIYADMPSSNHVWGRMLKDHGFKRRVLSDTCPNCYTVKQFCKDNPKGIYVLALNNHVVTVVDGDYYDSWDSGDMIPMYYWMKEV